MGNEALIPEPDNSSPAPLPRFALSANDYIAHRVSLLIDPDTGLLPEIEIPDQEQQLIVAKQIITQAAEFPASEESKVIRPWDTDKDTYEQYARGVANLISWMAGFKSDDTINLDRLFQVNTEWRLLYLVTMGRRDALAQELFYGASYAEMVGTADELAAFPISETWDYHDYEEFSNDMYSFRTMCNNPAYNQLFEEAIANYGEDEDRQKVRRNTLTAQIYGHLLFNRSFSDRTPEQEEVRQTVLSRVAIDPEIPCIDFRDISNLQFYTANPEFPFTEDDEVRFRKVLGKVIDLPDMTNEILLEGLYGIIITNTDTRFNNFNLPPEILFKK